MVSKKSGYIKAAYGELWANVNPVEKKRLIRAATLRGEHVLNPIQVAHLKSYLNGRGVDDWVSEVQRIGLEYDEQLEELQSKYGINTPTITEDMLRLWDVNEEYLRDIYESGKLPEDVDIKTIDDLVKEMYYTGAISIENLLNIFGEDTAYKLLNKKPPRKYKYVITGEGKKKIRIDDAYWEVWDYSDFDIGIRLTIIGLLPGDVKARVLAISPSPFGDREKDKACINYAGSAYKPGKDVCVTIPNLQEVLSELSVVKSEWAPLSDKFMPVAERAVKAIAKDTDWLRNYEWQSPKPKTELTVESVAKVFEVNEETLHGLSTTINEQGYEQTLLELTEDILTTIPSANKEGAEQVAREIMDQTPVDVILVTGKTYPSRHEIKALGGLFNKPLGGWLVPVTKREEIEQLASRKGYVTELTTVNRGDTRPFTFAERRDYKTEKELSKAEQLRRRADRRDEEIKSIEAELKPYDDMAFWTEPIHPGDRGRKQRNLREALRTKMARIVDLRKEAQELRDKADRMEGRVERRAESLVYMENRLKEAQANLRGVENDIAGKSSRSGYKPATGEWLKQLKIRKKEYEEQVKYWETKIEEAGGIQYSQDNVKVGDRVKIRGQWCTVVRVNPKTVTVDTPQGFTLKYNYSEIKSLLQEEVKEVEEEPKKAEEEKIEEATNCEKDPDRKRLSTIQKIVPWQLEEEVGLRYCQPSAILLDQILENHVNLPEGVIVYITGGMAKIGYSYHDVDVFIINDTDKTKDEVDLEVFKALLNAKGRMSRIYNLNKFEEDMLVLKYLIESKDCEKLNPILEIHSHCKLGERGMGFQEDLWCECIARENIPEYTQSKVYKLTKDHVEVIEKPKEIWEYTKAEYIEYRLATDREYQTELKKEDDKSNLKYVKDLVLKKAAREHEAAVTTRVAQHEPVPFNVLDDYPELKKKEPWTMSHAEFVHLYETDYNDNPHVFAERVGKPLGIKSQAGQPLLQAYIEGEGLKTVGESGTLPRDRWRRAIVRWALISGKDVPDAVLANFPDLKGFKIPPEHQLESFTGFRTEQAYGEGIRDISEVVAHEIIELGNRDIPKYTGVSLGDLNSFVAMLWQMGYSGAIWLCRSIDNVLEHYCDPGGCTIGEYTITDWPIILSDLGDEGLLLAYKTSKLQKIGEQVWDEATEAHVKSLEEKQEKYRIEIEKLNNYKDLVKEQKNIEASLHYGESYPKKWYAIKDKKSSLYTELLPLLKKCILELDPLLSDSEAETIAGVSILDAAVYDGETIISSQILVNLKSFKKRKYSEALAEFGIDYDKVSTALIEDGLAKGKSILEFDLDQIKMGIKVEMEHTKDPYVALEIAMDHLAEIPDYYMRLEKMEKEAEIGEQEEPAETVVRERYIEILNKHPGEWLSIARIETHLHEKFKYDIVKAVRELLVKEGVAELNETKYGWFIRKVIREAEEEGLNLDDLLAVGAAKKVIAGWLETIRTSYEQGYTPDQLKPVLATQLFKAFQKYYTGPKKYDESDMVVIAQQLLDMVPYQPEVVRRIQTITEEAVELSDHRGVFRGVVTGTYYDEFGTPYTTSRPYTTPNVEEIVEEEWHHPLLDKIPDAIHLTDDTTPAEIDRKWTDLLTIEDEIKKDTAPQIEALEKELKTIKGKRDKESTTKRKQLRAKIEELARASALARAMSEQLFIVAQDELRNRLLPKLEAAGITSESEQTEAMDLILSSLTERPYIEHTWKMTIAEIVEEVIEGCKPKPPSVLDTATIRKTILETFAELDDGSGRVMSDTLVRHSASMLKTEDVIPIARALADLVDEGVFLAPSGIDWVIVKPPSGAPVTQPPVVTPPEVVSEGKIPLLADVLSFPSVIIIGGGRRKGKTATGYLIVELAPTDKKFVLGLPESAWHLLPNSITPLALTEDVLQGLPNDSVFLIDEASLYLYAKEHKTSIAKVADENILKSSQRGQTFIFISHNLRKLYIGTVMEADMLIFKEPAYLQARSERPEIKPLMKEVGDAFNQISPDLRLMYAFVFSSRYTGMVETPLPSFWIEELGLVWRSYIARADIEDRAYSKTIYAALEEEGEKVEPGIVEKYEQPKRVPELPPPIEAYGSAVANTWDCGSNRERAVWLIHAGIEDPNVISEYHRYNWDYLPDEIKLKLMGMSG